MNQKCVEYQSRPHRTKLYSVGEWTLATVHQAKQQLAKIPTENPIEWDLSKVGEFDSAGVLLFIEFFDYFESQTEVLVTGYTPQQEKLYHLLHGTSGRLVSPPTPSFLERIAQQMQKKFLELSAFSTFLGHIVYTFFYGFKHPSMIRWRETVYHIHHSGVNALVIIGLTMFLVGMVISYQGSVQLAKFGADIFIVDTVGISLTRELAPMITAIVIAGRSGSAYTAEIGAMKITEEIAAMRTMGFDPYAFLVLPRILAMMIALPLLIFFADLVGIFGGMVAASLQLDISMTQFIHRLYEVLDVRHYLLGMIKGPVFAFLIVAIGCFRGFQVSDNTESLGQHTTASVVNGIFFVIAFDAVFSVIYTEFGL